MNSQGVGVYAAFQNAFDESHGAVLRMIANPAFTYRAITATQYCMSWTAGSRS
jgi:hypothetical protein